MRAMLAVLVVLGLYACAGGDDDDAGESAAGSGSSNAGPRYWDCTCTAIDGVEPREFKAVDGPATCAPASSDPADVEDSAATACLESSDSCGCDCKVSARECTCYDNFGRRSC